MILIQVTVFERDDRKENDKMSFYTHTVRKYFSWDFFAWTTG